MEDIFIQSAIGFFIAIVTSFITVKLSLNRYYAEKWWEKKYEAYNRLIDTMYDIAQQSIRLSVVLSGSISPSSSALDSIDHLKGAIDTLRKDVKTAEFLVSDEAAYYLSRLNKEIEKAFSEENKQCLSLIHIAVEDALPKLIKCARSELKIHPGY